MEENTGPIVSSITSSNFHKDAVKIDESVTPFSHWDQFKQEICKRKPIFNHYFSQCTVIAFDASNLSLSFIDAITLDQVKDPENLQLIKDTANSFCNRKINVQLTLNDKSSVSGSNPVNHKNRQKTETEIIQDALDVFGGIVIK